MGNSAILGAEIRDLTQSPAMLDNDKTLGLALKAVYSRGAFATNSMAITSSTTLDNRYNAFYFDTTGGAITANLNAANYWGVNKTPMLYLNNLTGSSTVTITPNGSDTVDGTASKLLYPNSSLLLWSDGVSKWSSFSMSGPFGDTGTGAIDLPYTTITSNLFPTTILPWNMQFSAASATLQTVLNYNGSGTLDALILGRDASGVVGNVGLLVATDGNLRVNGNVLNGTNQTRMIIGNQVLTTGGDYYFTDTAPGLVFKSNISISVLGPSAASVVKAAWKVYKHT